MALTESPKAQNSKESTGCVARSVANALAEEPTLEAVTINRAQQTISVATLGKTDEARLSERITRSLEQAQDASESSPCALLSGTGDCHSCDTPLSAEELHRITIRKEGDQTTIARVTCPTAPKFWRWRVMPFPKVVQRDVEFFEHPDHADEWKAQLVAAVVCGLLGLTGYFVHQPAISIACYVLAYMAGGWFTLHEVWERLQQWSIDVHFLMLAVAVGSASIGAWGEGSMLLFLFSFSGALEHYALGRTQREIRSLFREAPKSATVLAANGQECEVPLDQLCKGMRLLLKPGAQFPVDSEIVKGKTA